MSAQVVETVGLCRSFGHVEALRDLNLTVAPGTVYALLGRNGAGKSTAIRVLMGLIRPSAGTARVFDHDPWTAPTAIKQQIGYFSETLELYPWMRAGQLIELTAALYTKWDRAYEAHLVRRLELPLDPKISTLSTGMKRRLGLLLALCPRPELLILDEPGGGLDVVVRREFLDILFELLADESHTLLFASHIFSDVERIATHVGIIEAGALVVERPIDALYESVRHVHIELDREVPKLDIPGVLSVRRNGPRRWTAAVDHFDASTLSAIQQRLPTAQLEAQPVGLEEIFIDFVQARRG